MDNILEVNNLKISFRTSNGILKAVRNVSFNLERGKTLAIVGESGSGKSVTSKAILGILAGNSIIEGGEILFDGNDLLKLDEEGMYKIRGDKISMIFQDPLSSLNPIVKIGKQITEAMMLKNKRNRKVAKAEYTYMLNRLKKSVLKAHPESEHPKIEKMFATLDQFCIKASSLQTAFGLAMSAVEELSADIEYTLFLSEKKQELDEKKVTADYIRRAEKIDNEFISTEDLKNLKRLSSTLSEQRGRSTGAKLKKGLTEEIHQTLAQMRDLLKSIAEKTRPIFFRIGYYLHTNPDYKVKDRDIAELNQMTWEYMCQNFLDEFLVYCGRGLEHHEKMFDDRKRELLPELEKASAYFSGDFEQAEALKYAKELGTKVEESINHLEIKKDNTAYTFSLALKTAINQYFYFQKQNPKEEARFEKQTKKRQELLDKGKRVDWKVVPKSIGDLDELHDDIARVITHLEDDYKERLAAPDPDYRAWALELIEYLKEKASQIVFKLTKSMAREEAINLMEEVGIHEARKRFYQYPFEFSGGMRQRIVIAIALAANPDILICDEPTTALDVTIQAQILELINNLKKERNLSVIFITHDLGVVANMADSIAVMYAGKIVEYGEADEIFYDPKHPYTWALLASMPDLDTNEKLDAIPGTPPNLIYPPVGDAFADRNKYAMEIDFEQQPPFFKVTDTHYAATWLLHPEAPAVEPPKIIVDRIARMKKKAGGEYVG